MTKPFDMLRSSYDLLNGAKALDYLATEFTGICDGTKLDAMERDHAIFVMRSMAEKAEACASAWIDEIETHKSGPIQSDA